MMISYKGCLVIFGLPMALLMFVLWAFRLVPAWSIVAVPVAVFAAVLALAGIATLYDKLRRR